MSLAFGAALLLCPTAAYLIARAIMSTTQKEASPEGSLQANQTPAAENDQKKPSSKPSAGGTEGVNELKFFYEDVVYRIQKKSGHIQFGLVVQNAEIEDEDEDDVDADDEDKLKPGQVRVLWHPRADERIHKDSQVHLADRSLMPGDVVRRYIRGQDTQRGIVRDVSVTCNAQIVGSDQVVFGVHSERLRAIDSFHLDVAVSYGSWVGIIRQMETLVTLKFPDGSECKMPDRYADMLEDAEDDRDVECEFLDHGYFVGQKLKGNAKYFRKADFTPNSISIELRSAIDQWKTFLAHHRPRSGEEDTTRAPPSGKKWTAEVTKVETTSLRIEWKCHAFTGDPNQDDSSVQDLRPPPDLLTGSEDISKVRKLNVFESCTLQIGDKYYMTVSESDVILTKDMWRYIEVGDIGIKRDQAKAKKVSDTTTEGGSETKPEEASKEETSKEEASQATPGRPVPPARRASGSQHKSRRGGTRRSTPAKARPLPGSLKPDVHDRGMKAPTDMIGRLVVLEVLSTNTLATIVWQDGTVEEEIPSNDLYPILHLDEREFFCGDYVTHSPEEGGSSKGDLHTYGVIQGVDHTSRTCHVKWFKTYQESAAESKPSEVGVTEEPVYDLRDHPDFKYRPGSVVIRVAGSRLENSDLTNEADREEGAAGGQVVDIFGEACSQGQIEVAWANGSSSKCWPQDLYRIGDYDSDGGEIWDEDEADEWEEDEEFLSDDDENEDESGSESWETESEHSVADEGKVAKTEDDDKKAKECVWDSGEEENDQSCGSSSRRKWTHDKARRSGANKLDPDVWSSGAGLLIKRLSTSLHYMADHTSGGATLAVHPLAWLLAGDHLQSTSPTSSAGDVNPVQACAAGVSKRAKRLLDMHLSCQRLDKMLKTEHFSEEKMGGPQLIHKLRDLHQNGAQRAIQEQVTRLFGDKSEEEEATAKRTKVEEASCQPVEAAGLDPGQTKRQEEIKACQVFKMKMVTQLAAATRDFIGEEHFKELTECQAGPGATGAMEEGAQGSGAVGILRIVPMSALEDHMKKLDDIKAARQDLEGILDKILEGEGQVQEKSDAQLTTPDEKELKKESVEGRDESPQKDPTMGEEREDEKKNVDEFDELLMNLPSSRMDDGNNELSTPTTQNLSQVADGAGTEAAAADGGEFSTLETAPATHMFYETPYQPHDPKALMKFVRKEVQLLRSNLPKGIFVKTFEDRMDLFSVMIVGPEMTPYQDGLFFFDLQLSPDYPVSPPKCQYYSYVTDRLNPNLYENGKVCVSLLGTWSGKGSEKWTTNSNMLQLLVSIQGLILVDEPYYNEAGYERQKGTQQGLENSRMYNETVLLKLTQSMNKIAKDPPPTFAQEVADHVAQRGRGYVQRLEGWIEASANQTTEEEKAKKDTEEAPFPLLPASKGFCISLKKAIQSFKATLEKK